ncbi:MAG: two-component regulator propeller domain-containing protein [Nitrospirota bacterium]
MDRIMKQSCQTIGTNKNEDMGFSLDHLNPRILEPYFRTKRYIVYVSIVFISALFLFTLSCSKKKSSAGGSESTKALRENINASFENKKAAAHKGFSHPLWATYQLNTSVLAMAFEKGYLWVGTEMGLIKYDLIKDTIVERYDAKSLVSGAITSIKIDSKGNKWVGTHGGGLAKIRDGKIEMFTVPDLADPFVYDIVFDKDGLMWVANWKGVSIYDGKTWKSYRKKDGLIDDWVYAIAIDKDNVFWFGTEGGVTRFDGKEWKSYTHEDGLGADKEEIENYEKIDNPSRHHSTYEGKEAEGYNPNYILAAAVDKDNNKWFGTWGGGLSRFDGKRWKTFTTKDGLPGNFISDIKIEENGHFWIGTDGGVGFFDGKEWKTLSSKDGMVGDSVFTITIDDDGYKWFGTMEGISKLKGFGNM